MKKELEKELMSLAHRVLRRKDKADTKELKELALTLFEKLSLLQFAETHNEDPRSIFRETSSPPFAPQDSLESILEQVPSTLEFVEKQPNNTTETKIIQQLFEGRHEDYQRVISLLKTKSNAQEAILFVQKQVKPDYQWTKEYETVFLEYIKELYI